MNDAISPDEAAARGLRILAGPYNRTPRETAWMLAVLSDMRRGNIEAAIVTRPDGAFEVWRSGTGFAEVGE